MWKKIKKWWLKRKMRKALKSTVFQPPIEQSAAPRNTGEPPFGIPHWLNMPESVLESESLLEQRVRQCNYIEPELPTHCPQCNTPVTPSKIDDRVVACVWCKLMMITKEAHNDPNIQRDITHANAGVTPKQTKVPTLNMEKIRDFGGISAQDVMDVLHIKREIELDQARAFGEGYTLGKHGMSREEYNKKKRENLENENDI